MGKFLESEKPIQTQFKISSPYFSDTARSEGIYKGKPRSFCLPIESAEQNLSQKFGNLHFHTLPITVSNGTMVKMENQAITFAVRKFVVLIFFFHLPIDRMN
jgi:hypothetical protein